jgi:hypothetical protein
MSIVDTSPSRCAELIGGMTAAKTHFSVRVVSVVIEDVVPRYVVSTEGES